MRKSTIRLLLVLLSMVATTLQGQNITFNHLTTDDGLSQFSVNSLYIDENGVLWIGTREGLNRYDGEDIQTYKLQKVYFFLTYVCVHMCADVCTRCLP